MIRNNLSWMIGGPQGSGVDSSANVFAGACALGGLHIFGKREYYSNIKGLHSYFQIRASENPVRSPSEQVDILATFDAETVVRHVGNVSDGGGIIFDPQLENTDINQIPTLEGMVVETIKRRLESEGLGMTVYDLFEASKKRGVNLFPVPYTDLLREIGDEIGEAKISKLAKIVNILAVAISLSLVSFDSRLVARALERTFRGKQQIIDMNIKAAAKAYDYVSKNRNQRIAYKLEPLRVTEERLLLSGYQAVALGKLVGGCRFQTYYPITPAGDEAEYLETNQVLELDPSSSFNIEGHQEAPLTSGSILVVQTEDEIAAITMASGAALTGVRAATCTSGPGFSLMAEGLGWAGMNEVPVVVTLYQRTGPSTGQPTRHEQGDLRFALHTGHGEFPRIVLASGDVEECFYDAVRAFNYAETFQLPVIHLVDKNLANSSVSCMAFDPGRIKIARGKMLTEKELSEMKEEYRRFQFTEDGISPRATLGSKGGIFWNTGDEHDEKGHICEDPLMRCRMMEKRMGKLEYAAKEIPEGDKWNFFGDANADTTIVSWGSCKGVILDALEKLKQGGFNVNFLQLRLIHPFPSESVAKILTSSRRVVDVEMNYSGQLASVIAEKTRLEAHNFVLKYTGRPMTCDEVYSAMKAIVHGDAPRRQVMMHGA